MCVCVTFYFESIDFDSWGHGYIYSRSWRGVNISKHAYFRNYGRISVQPERYTLTYIHTNFKILCNTCYKVLFRESIYIIICG